MLPWLLFDPWPAVWCRCVGTTAWVRSRSDQDGCLRVCRISSQIFRCGGRRCRCCLSVTIATDTPIRSDRGPRVQSVGRWNQSIGRSRGAQRRMHLLRAGRKRKREKKALVCRSGAGGRHRSHAPPRRHSPSSSANVAFATCSGLAVVLVCANANDDSIRAAAAARHARWATGPRCSADSHRRSD